MKQPRGSRVGKRTAAARTRRQRDVRAPVGPARSLLRVEGQVARLQSSPDRRLGAKILYGFAVVVGLGMALAALWVDGDLWWGELLALVCWGGGFLLSSSDRTTRFDFKKRLVFQSKGGNVFEGIPFGNLVGILTTTHIVVFRSRETETEVRRFDLGLLVVGGGAPLRRTLKAMRRERQAVIVGNLEPATRELSFRLEREMQAHVLAVVDYTDETAVWQVSEWLAKRLDLPLIDACTAPTLLRVPEELDLSLGERLARGLLSMGVTVEVTPAYAGAPAPAGASVEWRRGKCMLSWRQNRWPELLLFWGLLLVFPAASPLFRDHLSIWLWFCAAVDLCLLPLALLATQWHGLNQLTLDRKRVVVTRGPFGKRLPPLATDSIEAVRVGGTNEYTLLSLVADQRVLSVPMTPPLARWAKQHIERQLLAVYEKQSKLPMPLVPPN